MSAHVCPSIVPTGRRETELIAAGLASLWLTDLLAPPSAAEIKGRLRVINE
jgi:hypothetical protein